MDAIRTLLKWIKVKFLLALLLLSGFSIAGEIEPNWIGYWKLSSDKQFLHLRFEKDKTVMVTHDRNGKGCCSTFVGFWEIDDNILSIHFRGKVFKEYKNVVREGEVVKAHNHDYEPIWFSYSKN